MRSEAVLLHPANVVACTALGVVAALLGVLLPCPRLATRDATDKRLAYLEVAAERVMLLAHAFQLHFSSDDAGDDERASYCRCRRRRRQCVAACMMSQADRAASAGRRRPPPPHKLRPNGPIEEESSGSSSAKVTYEI
uniref:Uncharacterized protein n=2 Tax=Oryza TaxID=4527 RepID=A0A0D3G9A5_9ORYZ